MKARLLALAVAVAMIVVAVLIRNRGTSENDTQTDDGDDSAVVICASELAALCGEIDGAVIEPVADTVDRLGAGGELPDAWVTFDPYPELVDQLRNAAGHNGTFGDGEIVGTSALVAVVRDGRTGALVEGCGQSLTWPCLGELAGDRWDSIGGNASWGTVKPGHDSLDGGRGPLALAAGVSAVIGGDGWGRAELESGPGADWLRRVERAQPSFSATAASALEQMLVLPASYDLVLTTADQAQRLVTATGRNGFSVAYPSPMRSVTVVVSGSSAGSVQGQLGDLVGDTPTEATPLTVDGGALGALVSLAGQL